MYHEGRERILGGERLAAAHILQVERGPVSHPQAGLSSSAIAHASEEGAIRTADMQFDDVRAGGAPTERRHAIRGGAGDGYRIRAGGQGGLKRAAGRVHRCETDVGEKDIVVRPGEVPDV